MHSISNILHIQSEQCNLLMLILICLNIWRMWWMVKWKVNEFMLLKGTIFVPHIHLNFCVEFLNISWRNDIISISTLLTPCTVLKFKAVIKTYTEKADEVKNQFHDVWSNFYYHRGTPTMPASTDYRQQKWGKYFKQ